MATTSAFVHARGFMVVVALLMGSGSAFATTAYLEDGAVHNPTIATWALPTQGTCYASTYAPAPTTRPECLGVRFPAYATQAACEAVGTAPNNLAWTSSLCTDLDPAHQTQGSCTAVAGRLWSNGVCAVTMKDHDRNVAACVALLGTWVTTSACTGRWNPPAQVSQLTNGTGPGDECFRCHNSVSQYNNVDIRWVETMMKTGHKNMARKVEAGKPWGGPPFECTLPDYTDDPACVDHGGIWQPATPYPSDDAGNIIDWDTGTVTIGGSARSLYWIFADWLSPLPKVIYSADPVAGKPGVSYACARCHTTGWTSDATMQTAKHPELSFPGVTWDGVTAPVTGQVNLASGVSGDTNKMASWDQYGITCSRCHNSAVDNTGGPGPFSSPAGMSSHHNNLTSAALSGGACTDPRFTTEATCEGASPGGPLVPQGVWVTPCSADVTAAVCTQAITTQAACQGVANAVWVAVPGFCSNNNSYTVQADCTGNGFTWQDGWCTRPDKDSGSCTGGSGTSALSWRLNGTQQSCQIAGGTWTFATCSVPAVCSKPGYANYADCVAASGTWTSVSSQFPCMDAGGEFAGNNPVRGQTITGLCMQCHRQEKTGLPFDNAADAAGTFATTNPGTYVKVGPYHGSVSPVSHPHGNMFLNSPHGQFSGTSAEIATARLGSGYGSQFMALGEAANTGNGCTGCHDVHVSAAGGTGQTTTFREHCNECHSDLSEELGLEHIDLGTIRHLGGLGTPLEHVTETEKMEACVTCHMPGGMHMFRINTDPDYSTYPASAFSGVVNANSAPDGSFPGAVWVDLDAACGQCHGGGTSYAKSTGSITANTKILTVASGLGFTNGQRVRVAGAGPLESDGLTRSDFESYIASGAGTSSLTLAGNAYGTAADAEVEQNPTKNGAPYYRKADLALVAEGMHDGAGVSYNVTFSTSVSAANSLNVTADATVSCGSSCPDLTYDWDWGDGSAHGSGDPAQHSYASAGMKTITLVVRLATTGKSVGTVSRSLGLKAPDLAPTAGAACTWTANLWRMSVNDVSTDDGPDSDALPGDGEASLQVVVDWGDGTTRSLATGGATLNHNYARVGTFTVTLAATDAKLRRSTATCAVTATPAYFSVAGTVKNRLGTTNIAAATVKVKNGATVVKTVYTNTSGVFSAVGLKPGSYTLDVTRSGYTFTPTPTTVGPSRVGITINAAAP